MAFDDDDVAGGRRPYTWPLIDPYPWFRPIADFFASARPLLLLLWPLGVIAFYGAMFNWYDMLAHIDRVFLQISFWQGILIGMISVNLFSKFFLGLVMAYYRQDAREFGVKLMFGVIPKFYVDRAPIRMLDLKRQRACFATAMIVRLVFVAVGFFLWNMMRTTGTGAADVVLALGVYGFASFLFVANPLFPADGCKWFSAVLNRPNLRQDSLKLNYLILTRRPIPPDLDRREAWAMVLFGVASIAFTALLIFLVISIIAMLLEERFQGSGVVMLCVILALVANFFLSLRTRKVTARQNGGVAKQNRGRIRRVGQSPRVMVAGGGSGSAGPSLEQGVGQAALLGESSTDMSGKPTRQRIDVARGGGTPDPAEPEGDRDLEAELEALLAEEDPRPPEEGGPTLDDLFAFEEEDDDADAMASAAPGRPSGDGGAPSGDAPGVLPTPVLGKTMPARRTDDPVLRSEPVANPPKGQAASGADPRARLLLVGGSKPEAAEPAKRPGEGSPPATGTALVPTKETRGRSLRRRPAPPPAAGGGGSGGGGGDDLDRVLRINRHARPKRSKWARLFVWAVVIGAISYVAMLPYDMEVGGEFIIQPVDRAEVRARTDGEIIELRVDEGDWVERNEIMAVLDNLDEKRDIEVREAELDRLRAEIRSLMLGASPEEIAVARQKVATAQLQVEIAGSELDLKQQLFDQGNLTRTALDEAIDAQRLADAALLEAEAGLAVVEAEASEEEIIAAEAEIRRHEADLAFARLKLEQTNVRATVEGQIVSSMVEVPIGAYLTVGGLFAELEDNRAVIAEIEMPETTIDEVAMGADVELRLWSDTGNSVFGTVEDIAPKAEEREFGRIVRVLVRVPNEDGRLTAEMTGQGKVQAETRPVWQVFTRIIVRFFEVELWSWLP